MICLHGKVVYGGIASGFAYVFRRKKQSGGKSRETVCAAEEIRRLELAVWATKQKLDACADQAESETARNLFEIHRMMLEDEDVLDYLHQAIRQDGATAETAVSQTERYFSELFQRTQDEYMIARIDDIRDVCGRLSSFLSAEEDSFNLQNAVVLVAEELLPGDLMQFPRDKLIAVIMGSGTICSHTSILLKEMGVPALICESVEEIKSGMPVIVNGDSGTAYVEPDGNTREELIRLERLAAEKTKELPFRNFSGAVYVNIGNPREVSETLFEKCDGVGLFRTEYLYFDRPDLPGEEEQFSVYKAILDKANGKTVTVRTFDLGSDKSVQTLALEREENPALGFRGLRVYSVYPDVFRTQIRALLRAAVYGNLRMMYPMVTSGTEIEEIKQTVLQVAHELERQGIPYKVPQQGAMIETPAAAVLSDEIAKTVDFFSVGTNDLTQYTLAIDRQDGRLDLFGDPNYKAVLALIRTAAKNAHNNGIEIGICGELASLPELTEKWNEFEIDSISVSASVLPRIS